MLLPFHKEEPEAPWTNTVLVDVPLTFPQGLFRLSSAVFDIFAVNLPAFSAPEFTGEGMFAALTVRLYASPQLFTSFFSAVLYLLKQSGINHLRVEFISQVFDILQDLADAP